MTQKDVSTAEKIKETARKLFTERGYGRVTTREIASSAGVNLALVNYYFGSKEELFNVIMMEVIQGFMAQMIVLLNDNHTFEEKLQILVSNYIDLLTTQPDMPLFMLSEMRTNKGQLAQKLGMENLYKEARFFRELKERCPTGVHPVQFFLNMLSLMVFPFVGKPMIEVVTAIDQAQFNAFMHARKELIPQWILGMLNPPNN
ncbi:MAG: TetR/AcrR family transcriptional regulator [Flavobacteriales bacterium]|nr:TetR/AcrR family transcriptional regulator [Flavobacteriales bacterium]